MAGFDRLQIEKYSPKSKSSNSKSPSSSLSTNESSTDCENPKSTSKLLSPVDLVRIAYEENGVYSGIKPVRVPLGVRILEGLVGGLSPGMLCIVGALPNVGKTTALIDWAFTVSESGYTAGIISLEDSPQLFGERIQAMYSSVSAQEIRSTGHLHASTGLSARVEREVAKARMCFSFPPGRTLDEVLQAIDDMHDAGCNVVYIDYFSAIENTDARSARAGYNQMLIAMKAKGAQLGMPIVLAAQIQRMPTKFNPKTNKVMEVEPDYSNLGETSFLERMAEVVVLLWKSQTGDTFGRLAKNKYGRSRLPKFNVWQDGRTGRLSYQEFVGDTLAQETADEE